MGAYSDFQNALNSVNPYVQLSPEEVAPGLRFTLQSINPQSNIYRTGDGTGPVGTSHMHEYILSSGPGPLYTNTNPTTWQSYLPKVHYIITILSTDPSLIPERLNFQIVQHETAEVHAYPEFDEGPLDAAQCRFINVGFPASYGGPGGEFTQISQSLDTTNGNSFYHTYTHPFDPDFVTNRLSWEHIQLNFQIVLLGE